MRRTPTSIAAALGDALAGSISPHAGMGMGMGMGVASAHGDQQRPRLQPQVAPGLRRRAKLLPTAVAAPHLTSRCHRNIHRHGKSPLLLLPPHGAPADCRMSSSSLQPLLCDSGRRAGGGGCELERLKLRWEDGRLTRERSEEGHRAGRGQRHPCPCLCMLVKRRESA